jgi:hypothetical protein
MTINNIPTRGMSVLYQVRGGILPPPEGVSGDKLDNKL